MNNLYTGVEIGYGLTNGLYREVVCHFHIIINFF